MKCRGCGGRSGGGKAGVCSCSAISTCYTDPTSYCVDVVGNGSLSRPFQFHSNLIPTIRPFGYLQQTIQQSNFSTGFVMPFNSAPTGIEGGMTNLTMQPTRLTASIPGIYLVGAAVNISADTTDSILVRVLKNNTASTGVNLKSEIPSDTTTRSYSLMTLITMVAGDYIQLHLDGSATMDAIVLEGSWLTTMPTLWASWIGTL